MGHRPSWLPVAPSYGGQQAVLAAWLPATVNDQKWTKPTPSVAWTRALLAHRNLRDTRVDTVYYSETQAAKHATTALLANRAALTQDMNFVHLKTKVSGSTHGAQ